MISKNPSRYPGGSARFPILLGLIAIALLAGIVALLRSMPGTEPLGEVVALDSIDAPEQGPRYDSHRLADAAVRPDGLDPKRQTGRPEGRWPNHGAPGTTQSERPEPAVDARHSTQYPAAARASFEEPSLPREIQEDETAIAGRVLDENGAPVDGARLSLHPQRYFDPLLDPAGARRPETTASDFQGFYAFPDLEPGLYRIEATAPVGTSSTSRILRTGVHSADLILDRGRDRWVRGRVTGSRGEPVNDALVFQADLPARATLTDAGGRYELPLALGARADTASLRFQHEEFREGRAFVGRDEWPASGPIEVDVRLESRRADGIVRGTLVGTSGEPVSGERVQLVSGELARAFHAVTDASGRFVIRGVPTETVYVVLVRPEGGYEDYTRRDLGVPNGGMELLITLQPRETGAVAGIVIDRSGRPIPGFELSLRSTSATRNVRSVTADPSGRFFVDEVPAGDLLFESLGYPSLTVRGVHLRPGTLEDVELVLDWGRHRVNGWILDAAGRPVPGSRVWLSMDYRSGPVQSRSTRHTTADAQGYFSFTGIGPGEHQVRVLATDDRTAAMTQFVQAPVERVWIQFD